MAELYRVHDGEVVHAGEEALGAIRAARELRDAPDEAADALAAQVRGSEHHAAAQVALSRVAVARANCHAARGVQHRQIPHHLPHATLFGVQRVHLVLTAQPQKQKRQVYHTCALNMLLVAFSKESSGRATRRGAASHSPHSSSFVGDDRFVGLVWGLLSPEAVALGLEGGLGTGDGNAVGGLVATSTRSANARS